MANEYYFLIQKLMRLNQLFYNGPKEIVKLSREHNNANILSLGARFMSEHEIYDVIEMWLKEPFEGGRHQKRIDKLDR